jgi:predicted transport protein
LTERPKRIEIGERELQALVENDLSQLEPDLMFVDHYLPVGTGIIDTLALDGANNPVVIEYKTDDDADEEALVQSLSYASWIDGNPDSLSTFLTKKKITPSGSPGDVRIILITPKYSERTLHAAQMIEPHIRLAKYICFEHSSMGKWLHFEDLFDSRKTRAAPARMAVYKIEDHFEGNYARMQPIFDRLESEARKLGTDVKVYAKKYYIAFQRNYIFGVVHVFVNKIEVGVVLEGSHEEEGLQDASDWGWSRLTHCFVLAQEEDVDDRIVQWLKESYKSS